MTNGTLTQIVSGIADGTEVLTDVQSGQPEEEEANANPFMPHPRKKNNDKSKK